MNTNGTTTGRATTGRATTGRAITGTVDTGTAPAGLYATVDSLMRDGHVPGLSMAVVSRDRLLFAAGFGMADLADAVPATPATAYLWFSMSKVVTATAAMRLSDDGLLDLDAPVGEYLDYLQAPGARQPTVRQLLDHTSGLADPLPIRWAHPAAADPPDPEVLLRRTMRRRRAYRYPVGAAGRYTNLGYLAAGEIITRAAGRPFPTYVRDAVLRPAGLTRTGFGYQPDADAATGYLRAPRIADPLLRRLLPAGVAGPRTGAFLSLNRFHVDGPAYGGLVGDVLDAGRFLRMHLGDGELEGIRVLSADTTREMRAITRPGQPFDHGIGWFRRPSAGTSDWVEHFGAGAGFWNVMRLYPGRDRGVVVMANSTSTYDFEPLFSLLAGASWS